MFGKKKQKTVVTQKQKVELNPEIVVANKLRLAAIRAGEKETKLRKTAYAQLKAAKTDIQKEAVRKQYRDNLIQLKLEANVAYTTYRTYIEENFDSGIVDKVQHPKGNNDYIVFITQRKFINDLQKATTKKSIATKPTKPKTSKTVKKVTGKNEKAEKAEQEPFCRSD